MIYTAMTIGPIYKTLRNAKKTREIWGGSYFFSFFMKEVIKNLDIDYKKIITPYVNENVFKEKNGVGLFHDRLIIEGDFEEKLEKIIEKVMGNIEDKSNRKITKNFLKNYLQIHILKKEAKNPLKEINPYLDVAELFFKTQKSSKNELLDFIKNRLKGSFLEKDAFEGKNRFESLPEIALSGLLDKEVIKRKLKEYNEEETIFQDKEIKQYLPKNTNYYKYIAIIQADGDNMGKVIEKIGEDKEKLRKFSKVLFDFCKSATQKVNDFGARMIYAGGDDLLFFAPVLGKNKKTIFEICNILSEDFNEKIEKLNLENKPTLSFGVGITYYKFPLYEARENAVDLLFNKAKSGDKNAIAFKIIKHSGQTFEGIVYKDDEVFSEFLRIISFNEKFDNNFLHSIHSKLSLYRPVFKKIMDSEERLANFFKNNFNENYSSYKDFFNTLIKFITLINSSKIEDKFGFLYSTLRIKKFLLGDKQ